LAIQSATALNAYLSAASSGPVDAGISSASTPDQGAVGQPAVARQELTPAQDAATQPAAEETDEAPGGTLAAIAASLPALYGRNARSVAAGAGTGARSISLLA
jgi:hypothetical protein